MADVDPMPLRVLSSMATKDLLAALLDGADGVTLESAGGVRVAERVRAGEPADAVVLADGAIERLASEGLVGPAVPLFVSEVVAAVPQGAPVPDLATVESLRSTLTAAESVGYSTGPSGDGLLALLEAWGLRDRLGDRLVQSPAGVPVAELVASGRVAIGVQQRSELAGREGVHVVGPFPPDAAIRTTFTGAVLIASGHQEQAAAVLRRLGAASHADIIRSYGMEPYAS